MNEQPAKLAVVGAGASGAEIASAFGRYGTEVRPDRDARPDPAGSRTRRSRRSSRASSASRTSRSSTGTRVEEVKAGKDSVELDLGREHARQFDYLCIAAGRAPDIEGARSRGGGRQDRRARADRGRRARCGRRPRHLRDRRRGATARRSRTRPRTRASSPSRTPPAWTTHPLDYDDIPGATFCSPQVASFGLTEAAGDASAAPTWWSASSRWAASARRPSTATARAWSRSIGDARYGELLGASIVGARATEMIAELVVAKQLEGGFEEIARTVHPHPTFSEAVMEARPSHGRLGHPRLGSAGRRRQTGDRDRHLRLADYRLRRFLLRSRLAVLVAGGRAGQLACCPSRRSGSRSCSAGCSRSTAGARGRDGRARRRACAEVERRAAEYGLPPVRWPDPWPGNMLARDAGRDLRGADRQGGLVLAGRLPAGVRRRPRPERPRQRA